MSVQACRKSPVDDVALLLVEFVHLVSDAHAQRQVGRRAHGNPFGIERVGRRVLEGADDHEFRTGLLGLQVIVDGHARRGPRRIRAVQHDVFGVLQVLARAYQLLLRT